MLEANIHLSKGRVLAALPYRNHYLVSCEEREVTAVALDSGGSKRSGVAGGGSYIPGTFVLLAYVHDDAAQSKNIGFPHMILGAFSPFSKVDDTDFAINDGLLPSDSNFIGPLLNPMTALLIEADKIKTLNSDHSYNKPIDAVAGEWGVNTALGGAFLLSDFMAHMAASPGCSITLDADLNLAEVLADRHRVDALHYLMEVYNKMDVVATHRHFAYNNLEGLGGVSNALKEETSGDGVIRTVPYEDNQQGFFRRSVFEGGSVEGSWDTFRTDLDESRRFYVSKDTKSVFPGLLSEARRMDGTYRLKAAKEIKFEKTPVIRVPQQFNEAIDTPITKGFADGFESREKSKTDKTDVELKETELGLDEDQQFLYNSLIHQDLADYDEEELFNRGLRKDRGVWMFKEREDISKEVFGKEVEYVYKLKPLDSDANEYTLDDLVSEDIEAYPGRKIKLFANSSVFLMADDGGIVLGDGYGGELRMNKGKVTIGSIGDIELLPGRDIVTYAGRNSVTRAKGRVELSSSDQSVSIKAEENLHLLSGNGGEGSCVIENRGSGDSLADVPRGAIEEGLAVGQGIVLRTTKSSTGIAMLGNYIYGGGYDDRASSRTGTTRAACNILLDSGVQGDTTLLGGTGSFLFNQGCSMGAANKSTGFYASPTSLALIAPSGIMTAAPQIAFDKGGGTVKKPSLTRKGIRSKEFRVSRLEPTVVVQGSMQVKRGIATQGDIFSEKGMYANDGFNGQYPADPEFEVKIADSRGTIAAVIANISTEKSITAIQSAVSTVGISTDFGKRVTGFGYPLSDSEAYKASNYSIVAPRWHEVLQGGSKWKEKGVKNSILSKTTYPYPGEKWFGSKSAVKSVEEEDGKLKEKTTKLKDWPING